MAVTRIVDSRWLSVEAAYIDWLIILRQRHQFDPGHLARALTIHQPTGHFRGARLTVALRWHLNAARGNLNGEGRDRLEEMLSPDAPDVAPGVRAVARAASGRLAFIVGDFESAV